MSIIDREWKSAAPRVRHVKPFDFIRGIGVIGVIAGHALPKDTLSFSAMVDWFLVLSGFLITTLLLQEHRETGRVALKKFYARRSLRLLPSLYVTLALTLAIGVGLKVLGRNEINHTLSGLAKEVVSAGLYVHNLVFPTQNGLWLGQLWTLGLEEQFYLVVGALMLVALFKGWIKPLTWMIAIAIVAIAIVRAGFIPGLVSGPIVAICAQRPDSLMVGMLAALLSARVADPIAPTTARRWSNIGMVAVVLSVLSVFASTTIAAKIGIHIPYLPKQPYTRGHVFNSEAYLSKWFWFKWGSTLAAVTMGITTFCIFRLPDFPLNRWLTNRRMVYVGGVLSYALYLVHTPVQYLIEQTAGGHLPGVLDFALKMVLPFAVAIPMATVVETKAMEIKNRFSVTSTH